MMASAAVGVRMASAAVGAQMTSAAVGVRMASAAFGAVSSPSSLRQTFFFVSFCPIS